MYLKTYLGGSLAIANHVSKFAKTVSILTDIGDRSKFKNFIKQNLSANVNLNLINKFDSETIEKRYIDAISNTKVFGLYKIDEKKYNNIQELKFQK